MTKHEGQQSVAAEIEITEKMVQGGMRIFESVLPDASEIMSHEMSAAFVRRLFETMAQIGRMERQER
jgi:hypothetical protein